ncbi:MAG: hypothetical protein IBJ07_16950 [Rhizobiaceae bacterium]|nr:hypothetical protein [Rhizobiaceae bacterium]
MRPAPFAMLGLIAALGVLPAAAQDRDGDFLLLSIEEMTATRERPLFAPDRRPPAPEPVVVVEPEAADVMIASVDPVDVEPPSARLIGVMILSADRKTAILRDETTGTVHRLRSGEELDGWTVTIEDATSITLAGFGETYRRKLFAAIGGDEAVEEDEASSGLWR